MRQNIIPLKPTAAAARYITLLCKHKGSKYDALHEAEKMGDSPGVRLCLRDEIELQQKGPVNAGTTFDPSWASPLISYGIGGPLIGAIDLISIHGALKTSGRRVGFYSKTPVETTATAGCGWVGENSPINVQSLVLETATLEAYKAATIVVLSKELLRLGANAEADITRVVTASVGQFLDQQLLDPSVGKSLTVNPGSLTSNIAGYPSTGSTDAALVTDTLGMMDALKRWGNPLWIGRPRLINRLCRIAGAYGFGYPNIHGIPVLASLTSPPQLTLIDSSDVLFADDGNIAVDYSQEASLVMSTTPASSPITSAVVSLYGRDLAAIRVLREVAWQMAHASSIVWMAISY